MNRALTIGVDSSTTATKAVLLAADGRIVGTASREYGYATPRPRWTEQDPALWWDATIGAVRELVERHELDPGAVDAIGLTGQMHGSVLLDAAGAPVRPAILWNDQRTHAQCDEIRDRVGLDRLIAITGNDAMTGFTAPKLLWVRSHDPDAWARVAHVMLPKDFLRFRMTGHPAVDVADGSGTALFDIAERTWSQDMFDALDLDSGLFPEVFEGPEITGCLSADGAGALGLSPGTPVVAGGGDQATNGVGVGAVDVGVVALSLGTSGVVFAATQRPFIEPRGRVHAFCHAVPDRWHMMGVMLSAAGSLRWLRDALAPTSSFEELVTAAADIPAGSDGLVFLPYLTGERTPHADPSARGAFVGLTVRHDLRHMTRAVLEGVAFGLRDALDLMVAAGLGAPREIRASGGGIRSGLWRQILADVLETTIRTVDTIEGAAFGAALLAQVGAGHHESVDAACEAGVALGDSTFPLESNAATYSEGHARFDDLYPALRPTFRSLDES